VVCQGAYNSEKPGNLREFVNYGKLVEFKIYSWNSSDADFFVTQSKTAESISVGCKL